MTQRVGRGLQHHIAVIRRAGAVALTVLLLGLASPFVVRGVDQVQPSTATKAQPPEAPQASRIATTQVETYQIAPGKHEAFSRFRALSEEAQKEAGLLLNGIRIVDMTSLGMGPYAAQILGDMGADVIKVESPDGDAIRDIAPATDPHMGAAFLNLNLNRNKQSIVLDLRRPPDDLGTAGHGGRLHLQPVPRFAPEARSRLRPPSPALSAARLLRRCTGAPNGGRTQGVRRSTTLSR